ncbi:methyl-accepting chemotaxis protein [Pseudomonas cerasi]
MPVILYRCAENYHAGSQELVRRGYASGKVQRNSEVRSLAQRSASAAKEISTLITNSVGQVEEGCLLVDETGVTMTQIMVAINQVKSIVSEISAASLEQSSGVKQVGQAITQIDIVTQQNAALVEQSAAAAESLKEQAQQLVQAVAVFRVTTSLASGT